MRRVSEFSAHGSLKRYYQRLCESAQEGYRRYLDSPEVAIHGKRSMASNINDSICAQLVNQFDGLAEPVFDKKRNIRFLKFGRRRPILLWLKKMSLSRQYSRVQTSIEDKTDHAERLAQGQSEIYPSAQILTLGYTPTRDGRTVGRVSITPPCRRGAKPDWWIDLVMLPVVGKPVAANGVDFRMEIKRSSHQRDLAV